MNSVAGERLFSSVTATRKGSRGGNPKSEFEIGFGVVMEGSHDTDMIRVRTQQSDSGVPPIVGAISITNAETLRDGLNEAILRATIASQNG